MRMRYIDKINRALPVDISRVLLFFIGILIVVLAYTNIRIDNIHTQKGMEIAKEEKFPVQTLDLRNTSWESNKFSGSITNTGTKDVFNVKIKLAVSRNRDKWEPEEQLLIIPYRIRASETLPFSEPLSSLNANQWWSSNIVDARYYNGEQISTPVPTQISMPSPTIYVPPRVIMQTPIYFHPLHQQPTLTQEKLLR